MFSKKNKDNFIENTKKIIKDTISEAMNITYMILDKRSLKVTDKMLIDLYVDFILKKYKFDEKKLIEVNNQINARKTDFLYNKDISLELIDKCFVVEFIHEEIGNTWDKNKMGENIKEKVLEAFPDITDKIKKNFEHNLELIDIALNYKTKNFVLKDTFFIINDGEKQYIYITQENLTLYNIRSFSFYINDKKHYKIVVMPSNIYFSIKQEIENYKNTKVEGLEDVRNPFLLSYLCNNMTNTDFGDFNLTYFYKDETNPNKINCSIRVNGKYQFLDCIGISDFDLNQLDSDIITIKGRLQGTITVTDLKVGRFSYRCLIIRKNGIYYLNLRKTEGIVYTKEELEEKSGVEIERYIIPEENNNKYVKLNPELKLKHFNIDFPLGYKNEDIDMMFQKLISASKGTFWINGKTNSWKSTSLKNLLLKFYDANIDAGVNKNIMMIENPIEGYDYYLKQVEVDDEDIEDYKAIIMAIKRADLDLCVIGELRTYDVFGIFNEISNSLPVFSTFHVGTIESFLGILKYYADKSDLNFIDVFGNVNLSIVQIPIEYETLPEEKRNYYTKGEENELLNYIYARFRMNRDDLVEDEKKLKNLFTKVIKAMFKKKLYPIKSYSTQSKYKLFYEVLTSDMLGLFISKGETELGKIYNYIGFDNNILYNSFKGFINGEIHFKNVKIDEYSGEIKIKTLEKILEELK